MRIYTVGGAVRDALLGLPVRDCDHVVVGSAPDEMLARGFKPVGKDFPVFLHPETREEYALARTERKSGQGYTGFVFYATPEVSLEEDLARRDLTINAMARADDGALIDPFNGLKDIEARVLRHVSPAFSEDPVRILRVARFAARFPEFRLAEETQVLMRGMVEQGEIDHLVTERVWQEIARGLMETRPSRMIAVLRECGALKRLIPEVDALFGVPQRRDYHPEVDTGLHVMKALDYAARREYVLPVRFSVLLHDVGKGMTPETEWPRHPGHEAHGIPLVKAVCARLRPPSDCGDLALLVVRFHGDIRRGATLRAETIVRILESADAFRRPERFERLMEACDCDFHGREGWENKPIPNGDFFQRALAAARAVDAGGIARACRTPEKIAETLRAARAEAVSRLLETGGYFAVK